MIKFIPDAAVGGSFTLFAMCMIAAGKNEDCEECEYYKKRFLDVLDSIRTIFQKFYNNELSAEDDFAKLLVWGGLNKSA